MPWAKRCAARGSGRVRPPDDPQSAVRIAVRAADRIEDDAEV